MRVGWLVDDPGYRGGAELTMEEFKAAAPDGVEVVAHPASDLADDAGHVDAWVVGNSVTYDARFVNVLATAPVIRYQNDLSYHGDQQLQGWLRENATYVFCSPLHRAAFKPHVERWEIVPPPVDLERFREARTGDARSPNACHVGQFMYGGKAGFMLQEWSEANQTKINVFGSGPFAPENTEWLTNRGPLDYEEVPRVLASHETHVHLPTKIEPFGRAVVEAWAAGTKTVVNGNVGARYYIEEAREKLETASSDFWKIVERAAS